MATRPASALKTQLRATKLALVSLVLLGAETLPGTARAQPAAQDGWYHHMGYGWRHMMGWGWGMFGGIGMILFWVLLIVIVVLLVRGASGNWPLPRGGASPPGSSALEILKERYAKGEISKDEYEERKKTLSE